MTDELTRLIDLPALARLSIAGDEIALLTLTHEHADKISIERRKLGQSIDLGDLLQLIGSHGLDLPAPQVHISEITAPQLPAPDEGPQPTTRRTKKHQAVPEAPAAEPVVPAATEPTHACPQCGRSFANSHALDVHIGRSHKATQAPAQDVPVVETKPEFPCSSCTRVFRSQVALDTHRTMVHWQEEEPPVTPEAPAERPVLDPNGICDICRRPVADHDRCAECGAMLSPGHPSGPVHIIVNDKPYCKACDTRRANARLVRTS